MALEVAIVDEFRQNELVIDGDGAGVEACLLFVKSHAGPGKDEVAGADGGRDCLGKCIHVNDESVGREGKERVFRLGEKGEFGVEVVFDDVSSPFLGPADLLVSL